MIERELYNQFKIYPEQIMQIGSDHIIFAEGLGYLLRPINYPEKMVNEKIFMGQWLNNQGDYDVAAYISPEGKRSSTIWDNGVSYIVFQLPEFNGDMGGELGYRLAQFHQLGYHYTPSDKNLSNQFLPWKERWERRLDQLENWYVTVTKSSEKTELEKEFCLSFPYFLGVSENAIQMIADMAIDDFSYQGVHKTICHERFQESTWLTIWEGATSQIKVPTDLTFDHYTRDIAEYIRNIWVSPEYLHLRINLIDTFLNEYEKVQPLSLLDQKLLFSRLLFPLHYFENIEKYYQVGNEIEKEIIAQKCYQLFKGSGDFELLFEYLFQRFEQLKVVSKLPHWIIHSQHSTD
ncbi:MULTISPECIES: spore coat putative kinase YutH [Bacillaceae]|uniref:Spore coat protein YutH n=1 Tax=Evansella alkalicola TaxID=745819 RepID=A0ABS6JYF3_9BACI|nr:MULTISPECIES: spore coat protein YutH [Bacillaceae]MBU9722130.1 spore coat protein YutH [Bacillus alkalicola]